MPLIPPGDQVASARDLTKTIAQVTASVGGLTFSVTLVTVTIGAQLYSPRVLRAFRGNRLYQATLSSFLGTFVFSLLALLAISSAPPFVPELSIALSVAGTVLAFVLFVAFITDLVRSAQAETVVRRLAGEAQRAMRYAWPREVGGEPEDGEEAWRRVRERMSEKPYRVRAPRGGFLLSIDGDALVSAAAETDGMVRQRAPIGEFVVSDEVVAELWCPDDARERLEETVCGCLVFGQERTVVQDMAYPIRQMVDLALRGFSPSLNDFTSAETAISSVADVLAQLARHPPVSEVRLDADGEPRLVARSDDVDALVRLGFEQLRVQAASDTTVVLRLLNLLAHVRDVATMNGRELREPELQARLLRDQLQDTSPEAAARAVDETYRELFGRDGGGGSGPGPSAVVAAEERGGLDRGS